MRKNMLVLLCVALGILMMSSVGVAGLNPGTGIKQTAHDLSVATGRGNLWNAGSNVDSLDRICIYCHAPHHTLTTAGAAAAGLTYYPLWNHQVTTAVYELYSNTPIGNPDIPNNISHQLNATLTQPGSISKLCLSCHDGTVAVNQYGYAPATSYNAGNVFITSQPRFGIGVAAQGGLQNHHPIGFDYGAVFAIDDEIKDPASTLIGNNPYGLTINDLLFGNKMECASCHDVHNTKNTGNKFLWVEDTNSNLCLSCHAK